MSSPRALLSFAALAFATTLASLGCDGLSGSSTKAASASPAFGAPKATAKAFAADARFLPIPAGPRQVRAVARGGVTLDVTPPAASLSEDHFEAGETHAAYGINNQGGIGAWRMAGFQGVGEYPLSGPDGAVKVYVDLEAGGEKVAESKILRNGVLRIEQLSIGAKEVHLRATAYGDAQTDSGKVVNVQFAANVVIPLE